MKVTKTAHLDADDLEIWTKGNDREREKMICRSFKSMGNAKLIDLLSGFRTDHRESINDDIEIDDFRFDDGAVGYFGIEFTGSVYMGCKDQNYDEEHYETVRFEVSVEDENVSFEVEPPDEVERYPDDEF